MTLDHRLTPATETTARDTLRGLLDRPNWTGGQAARIAVTVTDLCRQPGGARDRQVIFGTDITVIETRADWCFVQSSLDGYCGWLRHDAISGGTPPLTHRLHAAASHIYPEPDIKTKQLGWLTMNSRLSVTGTKGRFARLADGGYVPLQHITDTDDTDPVAVAERLLHTPYLWGGNSRAGIDCSGLVQAAATACGLVCPGDSDLQRTAFPPATGDMRRGDLLFWPGHIAMVSGPDMMIHANANAMAVCHEPISAAKARIDAAGEGPFLDARRPAWPVSGITD